MRFASALALFATAAFPSVFAANTTVTVGLSGNIFKPSSIKAEVGDFIRFAFFGGDHTLTQAPFSHPCTQAWLDDRNVPGIDLKGAFGGIIAIDLRIESTQPMWFFCRRETHCNSGMVMVINPTASQTLEQFKANAATAPIPGYGIFANLSASSDSTGVQSVPTAQGTSTAPTGIQTSQIAQGTDAASTGVQGTPTAQGTSTAPTGIQTLQIAQGTDAASTGVQGAPSAVIIGGTIGGVVVLTIVIGSILWYQRRKRNRHPTKDDGAVHAFEVENASAFPKRLENHTLGKSSRALGPRTMTSQPITDPPERALGSSNPFQQGSPDSLLLGLGLPSSSGPPQTIENNDIPHSPPPPTYLPAPLSPDLFPVPLSPRPPPYFTVDMARRQSNLPEFDPSMTQNVVGRSLTDSDVEAIARRVTEMQRDQRR